MARKDDLLRLQLRLVARRDELRNSLADDWESNRWFTAKNEVGDTVDAALDAANDEISSRFAEKESRELEMASTPFKIVEGAYGRCEYCGEKIAASRLNALSYTNSCIDRQRANERNGTEYGSGAEDQPWARAYEKPNLEESGRDSPIGLRDFQNELSETP